MTKTLDNGLIKIPQYYNATKVVFVNWRVEYISSSFYFPLVHAMAFVLWYSFSLLGSVLETKLELNVSLSQTAKGNKLFKINIYFPNIHTGRLTILVCLTKIYTCSDQVGQEGNVGNGVLKVEKS